MKPQPTPNQPPTEAVFLSPDDPLVQLLASIVKRMIREKSSTETTNHDQSRNLCESQQRTAA